MLNLTKNKSFLFTFFVFSFLFIGNNVLAETVTSVSCDSVGLKRINTTWTGSTSHAGAPWTGYPIETKTNSYFAVTSGVIDWWAYSPDSDHLITWANWDTFYGLGYFPLDFQGVSVDYFASSSLSNCGNPYSHATRIVSITTPQNFIATSTSVLFSGTYYLNGADASTTAPAFGFTPKIRLFLSDEANGTSTVIYNIPITVADSVTNFSYLVTGLKDDYRYAWTIDILGNNNEPISNGLFPDGLSFWQFTTGTFDPTYGQNFDLSACNVLSGFDAGTCVYNLLMPNDQVFASLFNLGKQKYMRAKPIGYVSRFIEILASEATSSLPVISATVPNGIIGAGASISLDINHSLDQFLYATTSGFMNESAPSDDTLYDITSYYWNILVYMAFVFYLMRRIIGSHIIPKSLRK